MAVTLSHRSNGLPFWAPQRHTVPCGLLSRRPCRSHFDWLLLRLCVTDSSVMSVSRGDLLRTVLAAHIQASSFHQSCASAVISSRVSSASSRMCRSRSRSQRSQLVRAPEPRERSHSPSADPKRAKLQSLAVQWSAQPACCPEFSAWPPRVALLLFQPIGGSHARQSLAAPVQALAVPPSGPRRGGCALTAARLSDVSPRSNARASTLPLLVTRSAVAEVHTQPANATAFTQAPHHACC